MLQDKQQSLFVGGQPVKSFQRQHQATNKQVVNANMMPASAQSTQIKMSAASANMQMRMGSGLKSNNFQSAAASFTVNHNDANRYQNIGARAGAPQMVMGINTIKNKFQSSFNNKSSIMNVNRNPQAPKNTKPTMTAYDYSKKGVWTGNTAIASFMFSNHPANASNYSRTSTAMMNHAAGKDGETDPKEAEATWGDVKRKPVVGGNWKSNGDMEFINSFPEEVLNKSTFKAGDVDVAIAPTDIHLTEVMKKVKGDINVMAQNVSQYEKGAYTGNVTADQLKDIGVGWTLTGHSERRTLHKESDEDVAKKTKAAADKGMMVMACIGEQLDERESGKTDEVNSRQLQAIADQLTESQWGNIVIAYEPVWAIGTGKVATPEQAQETHHNIRHWLLKNVSKEVAGNTRILYGGSVNGGNCEELIKKPDIDGFLVGGASLKPEFKDIIEAVASTI